MWGFSLHKRVILYLMKSKEMVYLKNINEPQEVFVPKCRLAEGGLVLTIKGVISHSDVSINVFDLETSGLYFRFSFILPENITSGEHEYTLSDDDGVLSTGLLIVGEPSSPIEYNKTIQYEQL